MPQKNREGCPPHIHMPEGSPLPPFSDLGEQPPLQIQQPSLTLLVLSDTHDDADSIHQVLLRCPQADAIIHLGDHDRDILPLRDVLPCPVYAVRGNCDMHSASPLHLSLTLGGVRIFATHGHEYGVKQGTWQLIDAAKEGRHQLVLFGHTHQPLVEHHGSFVLLNPGSPSLPRNPYAPSFALITLKNGKVHPSIVAL